jgi:hypothetical protein
MLLEKFQLLGRNLGKDWEGRGAQSKEKPKAFHPHLYYRELRRWGRMASCAPMVSALFERGYSSATGRLTTRPVLINFWKKRAEPSID